MRTRSRLPIILLALIATSFAQQISPDLKSKIDDTARQVLTATGVPSASIAVVQNGQVVYTQAYGDARVEPGPVEAHQGEQGVDHRHVADGMGGEHPRQPAGLVAQVAADWHIAMGDGGNQKDPHHNGQNNNTLLAKMLRIDVTPREGYAVPKDNPFIGMENRRAEIWAYGLRNPWRFSFDRETGLLYEGDVGEERWEEVNIIKRGGNYGWSVREGDFVFNRESKTKDEPKPTERGVTPAGWEAPIKTYWHDIGQSITGGYVYRGKAIPELKGWYLYGDYSKGTIWGLKYDGKAVTDEGTLKISNEKEVRPMLPSSFGEDDDGEIYVCSHQDGKIWKIVPANK